MYEKDCIPCMIYWSPSWKKKSLIIWIHQTKTGHMSTRDLLILIDLPKRYVLPEVYLEKPF